MKNIIIASILITLLVFIIFDSIISEIQNQAVLDRLRIVGAKLVKYKMEYGELPNDLNGISEEDKICIYYRCFNIVYKISENSSDFEIVSAVNYPLVAYFHPEWELENYSYNCCYYFIYNESYNRSDMDWKVWR